MGKKKEILIEIRPGDIWDSATKTLFRKTKAWIEFRNRIIKEREKCEICGYNKRLTLHHIEMSDRAESYSKLEDNRFKVCCAGCHKYIHRLFASYTRKKDPIKPDPRIESLLNEFVKEELL